MSITVDTSELDTGLERFRSQVVVEGGKSGLGVLCTLLSDVMQQDQAHGDVTGASHANYAAYPVGEGDTGESIAQSQASVVEQLNPGHSALAPLSFPKDAIGAVVSSATDYQEKLETEEGGRKAVIVPTLQQSAQDFTRYAAEGMRDASR